MNFGKLLAAGKSFLGGRGEVAYRSDKRVYLPKFNAAKNPFEPKTAEKKPGATDESQKAAGPVVVPAKAKTQKIPVFAAQKALPSTNWAERLNPFRSPPPVAPRLPSPVQTELSLNAVKVLHNDLSDADVEVVPVKSRTMTAVETPRLPASREPLEFFRERQLETA